jgi:uncharacterized repeat protein (TIGR03803 family)
MRLTTLVLCILVLAACARGTGSSPIPAGQPFGFSVISPNNFGHKTIFRFKYNSTSMGELPYGEFTNVKGTLYGSTTEGGTGTVYKLETSGGEEVLHIFQAKSDSDGAVPVSGLTYVKNDGKLYGMTSEGGGNRGTAYQIRP